MAKQAFSAILVLLSEPEFSEFLEFSEFGVCSFYNSPVGNWRISLRRVSCISSVSGGRFVDNSKSCVANARDLAKFAPPWCKFFFNLARFIKRNNSRQDQIA
jgi:hypothetical protein